MCFVTVVFEELNRVRTEIRIGKKHLRRRRRINEEVQSNQQFTTGDDDAIEVQRQATSTNKSITRIPDEWNQ